MGNSRLFTSQEERDQYIATFERTAGANAESFGAAVREYRAYQQGGGLQTFDHWIPMWAAERDRLSRMSTGERIGEGIKSFFNTPGRFGVGSLLGAIGLGAVGHWLGGMWMAVPLAAAGGLFGETVVKAFTGTRGTAAPPTDPTTGAATVADITTVIAPPTPTILRVPGAGMSTPTT